MNAIHVILFFSLMAIFPILLNAQEKESNREEAAEKEKKEPYPELGVYVQRSDGTFLNIRIVERKLRVYFMDAKKYPMEPPDVTIIVRYENVARRDREATRTLRRIDDSEGAYFSVTQDMRRPWDFWMTVIVKYPDKPDAKELYPRIRVNLQRTG